MWKLGVAPLVGLITISALQGDDRADKQPPPASAPALDQQGDPLPAGAVARLGTVRWRHAQISSMVLSPDGKVLATGTWGGSIRLWDRATGKLIGAMHGSEHRDTRTWQLAFSPDSAVLACGNSEGVDSYTIRLWNVATKSERSIHFQPKDRGGLVGFRCLAFFPDGKTLASAIHRDNKVRLWDVASGQAIEALPQPSSPERMVCSPDGTTLALAYGEGPQAQTNHKVALLDPAARTVRRTLAGGTYNSNSTRSLTFSPDGKMLTQAMINSVYVWDLAADKRIGPLNIDKGVQAATFAPDGKSLLVLSQRQVLSFDPATGKETGALALQDEGHASSFAHAPGGKLFVLGMHLNTLKVWESSTGKQLVPDKDGHRRDVVGVAFSPDGAGLTSISDKTIRHWNLQGVQTRALSLEIENPHSSTTPIALSPDGRVVASLQRLWDAKTGRVRHTLGRVRAALERQDLFFCSSEEDEHLPGIDDDDIHWCAGPSDDPTCLAFSADSKTLAAGYGDKKVVLWDPETGRAHGVIDVGESPSCLALSPDGAVLAAGAYLWDANTGKKLTALKSKDKFWIRSAAVFSADGRILAAQVGDGSIRSWETATGAEIVAILPANQRLSGALAVSPDGRLLAGQTDGKVCLWESVTGKQIGALTGHGDAVLSLAFSADGRRLVSGSRDTTCLVWSLPAVLTPTPDKRFDLAELDTLWRHLAAAEAQTAHAAGWRFHAAPADSVRFLSKQLLAYAKPDPQRVQQLVADLDAKEFRTRADAHTELEKLGELAFPALRQALAAKPSLEMQRRIEQLLDKRPGPHGEELRAWRALGVLENIGTPEARHLLEKVRDTAPWPRIRAEARSAAARLAQR